MPNLIRPLKVVFKQSGEVADILMAHPIKTAKVALIGGVAWHFAREYTRGIKEVFEARSSEPNQYEHREQRPAINDAATQLVAEQTELKMPEEANND